MQGGGLAAWVVDIKEMVGAVMNRLYRDMGGGKIIGDRLYRGSRGGCLIILRGGLNSN